MKNHTGRPLILLLYAMGMSQALSPVWASLPPDADATALAIYRMGSTWPWEPEIACWSRLLR